MAQPKVDIAGLSPAERLELIEEIWESLAVPATDLPVPEAQRVELRRRLEAFERGELKTIPLDKAIGAIRAGRASHQSE